MVSEQLREQLRQYRREYAEKHPERVRLWRRHARENALAKDPEYFKRRCREYTARHREDLNRKARIMSSNGWCLLGAAERARLLEEKRQEIMDELDGSKR